MTIPYQPEPGCSARQRQLEQQVRDLTAERTRLEDELGEVRQRLNSLRRQTHELGNERDRFAAGSVLVCSDERHAAKVRGLEAEVKALHHDIAHGNYTIRNLDAGLAHAKREVSRTASAWKSTVLEARRQAARADAAEARLTELEADEGDWLTNVLYARKMSIVWGEPSVSPAFTGDTAQPIDQAEPVTLTARHLSYSRPACAGCEWAAHPPLTCDEVAAFRDRFDSLLAEGLKEIRTSCTGACSEGHTYQPPCEQAVGPVVILPPQPVRPGPMLFQPCSAEPFPGLNFDDMVTLINEYQMPEQGAVPRREMQRSEPSSTGLTVVTTDPVQEIAAEPATLDALKRKYFAEPASRLGAQVGQIGQFFGFPMIADTDLPPGEVHMRPHPQRTEDRP